MLYIILGYIVLVGFVLLQKGFVGIFCLILDNLLLDMIFVLVRLFKILSMLLVSVFKLVGFRCFYV